ncbi:hypothetical protein DJ568_06040 [Mucilaginibacter hurinus]|uniref:Uncharacterized protein n=1 Tax=Mucilaginibacter hurinus TaxID=2201324 RepID=A0A367GRU2_9SPHI|nr:hypothetical protein [Mucilaginibacter hurinus]RCH55453.1 hypothetical protein DJ568_06040 [Mucilaginibacter hurinus]
MKNLKFHFCHPVKGVINFFHKNPELNRALAIDTQAEQVAIVPIDGLPGGKWKAMLEWEYDGKEYIYEKEFEVKEEMPASE